MPAQGWSAKGGDLDALDKKLMPKNKKIQTIIFILILALIPYGIFSYVRSLINTPLDIEIPKEFMLGDAKIALAWTDDNTGENLIIQSDKKTYLGLNQIEVYFSITNTTKKTQDADIVFWVENEEVKVGEIIKLSEDKQAKLQITRFRQGSGGQANSKPVNDYQTNYGFQDNIQSGQTNYYRALLSYPENSQGEFFIEAFGNPSPALPFARRGGGGEAAAYGHLDPYYASGLVGYWSFDGPDMGW
ncbi:MAG: hypothetical protein COV91_04060, partial [Candidatus Taylorbacteria bacterium CG11_big_fil_rev_8_21_14_0_20_46_11]